MGFWKALFGKKEPVKAFIAAVEAGDWESVKALVKENPDFVYNNNLDSDMPGCTPLYFVAAAGQKDVAELMLAYGAEVNPKSEANDTPLHAAVSGGNKAVVELLLAKKAEVNAKTTTGVTPLHAAAEKGDKAIAELLLANGADVNAESAGYIHGTPLSLAMRKNHKAVAQLLRQHGGHE